MARLLLSKGHTVRALTRKAGTDAAKELSGLGAQIVEGSIEDTSSLTKAAVGVDAIFGVTTPFEEGMDAEVRQGRSLVDAAKSAGVSLVLNSVAFAWAKTRIPHFESKWKVEEYLGTQGIRHTIIGPCYFMDNAIAPWSLPAIRDKGVVANPASPDLPQPMVAVEDIAQADVLAIEQPDRFNGKRIDVASDVVTGEQITQFLSEATGKQLKYMEVPKASVEDEDLRLMYEWYEHSRPTVNLAGLRREMPEIRWTSYREWAGKQDWPKLLGQRA